MEEGLPSNTERWYVSQPPREGGPHDGVCRHRLGVWSYRRAAWCALGDGGAVSGEGVVVRRRGRPGAARGQRCGTEVRACRRDDERRGLGPRSRLRLSGWRGRTIAHARKVRDIAPLACKTDKVDAPRAGRAVPARSGARRSGCHRSTDRALREQLRPADAPRPPARLGDEPDLRAADAVGAALSLARLRDPGRDGAARRPRRRR